MGIVARAVGRLVQLRGWFYRGCAKERILSRRIPPTWPTSSGAPAVPIVDDDRSKARALIKKDRGWRSGSWKGEAVQGEDRALAVMANDTALHLAAAGHRVEIGADTTSGRGDVNSAPTIARVARYTTPPTV